MESLQALEKYPAGTVLIANTISAGIYGLGFYILLYPGWMYALLFAAAVLMFEIRLLRNHCTKCYYWGKTCGFGRGWISAGFFKKGEPLRFSSGKISLRDLIPDILITLIPLTVGTIFLILDFSYILLGAVLILLLLVTAGNKYVRGSLTCKCCKQRELGCPAWALFNRER